MQAKCKHLPLQHSSQILEILSFKNALAEASTSGSKPAVDETANKLDSMMELAFEHLHRLVEAHSVLISILDLHDSMMSWLLSTCTGWLRHKIGSGTKCAIAALI